MASIYLWSTISTMDWAIVSWSVSVQRHAKKIAPKLTGYARFLNRRAKRRNQKRVNFNIIPCNDSKKLSCKLLELCYWIFSFYINVIPAIFKKLSFPIRKQLLNKFFVALVLLILAVVFFANFFYKLENWERKIKDIAGLFLLTTPITG